MVRRAGASKACLTCLKRKKGCDQQRPACGQCRAACVECLGYARPLKFRNSIAPQASTTPSKSITIPDTLTRTAYQTKLIGSYWQTYLPNGQPLPSEVTTVGGWIDSLQQLVGHEDLIRKGLLALSLGLHGRVQREEWMSEEGQKFYGDAMHDLAVSMRARGANAIQGKHFVKFVATVRLLSFFEAMQPCKTASGPIQAQNWMVHNLGEAALLSSQSPDFYSSGRAHRLFADGRINLVCAALRARKNTFLSEPKWKRIPWSIHGKSARDHLVDIFVDLPTLLEDLDALSTLDPRSQAKRITALCNGCLDMHRRLLQWHEEYQDDEPEDFDERAISDNTFIDPTSLLNAHLSTLYYSISIRLYAILHTLDPTDEVLPTRTLSTICCQNILRAFPILVSPATGVFRIHLASFPITTLVRYLASRDGETMKEERTRLAGFLMREECETMRRFIGGMQPENMAFVLGEGDRVS